MEGVTGRQREDVFQEKKVLKILLWTSRFRRGRTTDSQAEAVQLHFIAPFWDLQVLYMLCTYMYCSIYTHRHIYVHTYTAHTYIYVYMLRTD